MAEGLKELKINLAYANLLRNKYREAEILWSEAILLAPDDKRLYANRCYTHLCLNNIISAEMDAKYLILKYPNYSNGFYLYGEVCFTMNKYVEAEKSFLKSYALTPRKEAYEMVFRAKMSQILAEGYTPKLARRALRCTQNIKDALFSLKHELVSDEPYQSDLEVVLTTAEITHLSRELEKVGFKVELMLKPKVARPGLPEVALNPFMDPNNPRKVPTLWVGNMTEMATEAKLRQLFGKYGPILSITLMKEKYCAFINYQSYKSAALAMKCLQDKPFDTKKLVIKYPDRAVKQ